ncbi:hypothetical protein [Amycolatopsis keratiniphila]|uniref:Uncharacterized protein n=1 Tax=Amycolatopsis keratiniphila subsp. keratiniphila TaxID=227715 RepID=A0A1W2LHF6_9PSEU|nr:hypothetical protein [Amycolatopsis keratiniphila]ONF62287.1 hypothetical protein AVR91_0238655 [Amycolatopsis keratiniphila subsp. keratiniphila]
MSRDLVTTLLDLAGLLLVAAGIGAALFPLIGWATLGPVGVLLLAGSRVAVWIGTPAAAPVWWRKLRGGGRW